MVWGQQIPNGRRTAFHRTAACMLRWGEKGGRGGMVGWLVE